MLNLCLFAPRAFNGLNGGISNWERIIRKEIQQDTEIKLFFVDSASLRRSTDGGTLFYRIWHGSYVMLRAIYEISRQIKKEGIDIAHITTSGGLGFIRDYCLIKLLAKKGIPTVYHIHFGRTVMYHRNNTWHWKIMKQIIRLADCTIAIDKKTYNLLKPVAKNVVQINNPIDINSFNKYNITYTKKIVFIGWLIKEKGIEELLQAYNEINTDFELLIIGPGTDKYVKHLKDRYNLNNIRLIGELKHEEAMKILAEASLFVLPSYTEGFPNVILEAMALCKPVIATNVGAIPEMIPNEYIVKPRNSEELRDMIKSVLANSEFQKIGQELHAKVLLEYNGHTTYEKYRKIWKDFVQKRSKNVQ